MSLRKTSFGNIRSSNLGLNIRATNWNYTYIAATFSFSLISVANLQMNNSANFSLTITLDINNLYRNVSAARYASLYEMVMRFGALEMVQRSDRSSEHEALPEMLNAIALNTDMTILGNELAIAASVDAARIIQHYAAAVDDFVDSYLSDYHVELIPEKYDPPHVLQDIACNILRWHLYLDGGFEDKHIIQRRYEDAVRKLEMIRLRKLVLPIPRASLGISFNTGRKHWGF